MSQSPRPSTAGLSTADRQQLAEWLSLMLEQRIDPATRDLLEQRLRDDSTARRFAAGYVQLHIDLSSMPSTARSGDADDSAMLAFSQQAPAPRLESGSARPSTPTRSSPALRAVAGLVAIAASVTLLLLAQDHFAPTPDRPPATPASTSPNQGQTIPTDLTPPKVPAPTAEARHFATLIEAGGCSWAGSELPTLDGSRLGAGLLDLREGIASVSFDNGAEMSLEAPVRIRLEDVLNVAVESGAVMLDVPESAIGFTVTTPQGRVVDFGTRFGVTAGPNGQAHVVLFEGEVEVEPLEGESRRLVGSASHHFGKATPETARGGEPDRGDSPEAIDTPPGWTSITTAIGSGRDTFVRRPRLGHVDHDRQSMILVKHSTVNPTDERKGYLAFDLSGIDLDRVIEAELTLQQVPSSLGHASVVPDSVFAIYAVTEPAVGGDWAESGLTWDTAPANLQDERDPDPSMTSLVGTFEIGRGQNHQRIRIATPELAALLREWPAEEITLILVRETDELDRAGLVHAFASRRHPHAAPPELRLRLEPTESSPVARFN